MTSSLPGRECPITADWTTAGCSFSTSSTSGGIDVEAGADNQLLGAADDVEGVVFEPREIAGVEPAIGVDHRRGRFWGPVISPHDIGTADVKLADFARSDHVAIWPYQARLNPGDQRTDGVVASRRLRPDARDSGGTFSDAIAVAQWQPEFRLDLGFQRHVERRAGDGQPAKLATRQLGDTGQGLVFQ
jgi:hypothetical protein